MYSFTPKYIAVFLFTWVLALSFSANADSYTIEPPSKWVTSVPAKNGHITNQQEHSNGIAYSLVDEQLRVDADRKLERYFHYVSKALNTSGVEDISRISIGFDPIYETVKLHKIAIHRGDQVINMIDRTKIDILQREQALENLIYDGSKTINVFIEDIRPDDSVEYSYSIVGSNPVFSGHFASYFSLQWPVPVERVHYKIVWPTSRPLIIRNHLSDINPSKKTLGDFTEYLWDIKNVERKTWDDATPNWYDPHPGFYLSDMQTWKEVVEWALPLYGSTSVSADQLAVIEQITQKNQSPKEKILAALRFVQNEIRYLGIEIGSRSHKPHAPDTVLKQRFGDCKDKSVLLVSLLQAMGIDASPVLVHNRFGEQLHKALPTPRAFNHVITQVRLNDKVYWLDPTRTYQAGSLDTLFQADYGFGLVISDESSDLVNISEDITYTHSKVVEESYDISSPENTATYNINTHFGYYYADDTRRFFSESNHDDIQQDYLNYFARTYPEIKVADELVMIDNPQVNRVTTKESYKIDKVWLGEDGDQYTYVNFVPFLLSDHIKDVSSPIRTMPYAISHPVRYQQTTRILVPDNSAFENESVTLEDKAFSFSRNVMFENDLLTIDYIYESRADHVAPEDIALYSENVDKLQDMAFYQIYKTNPNLNYGTYEYSEGDVNWVMVIFSLASFVVCIVLALKYVYLHDPEYVAPDDLDSSIKGIAGWLLLPALAVIINPIRVLTTMDELAYIYSEIQWEILGNGMNGTALQYLVAGEILLNIVFFVVSIFIAVMFFQKRHTFPRVYIAFLVFTFVAITADTVASYYLLPKELFEEIGGFKEVLKQGIATFIWGLYFLESRRVKATFVNQRGKPITKTTPQLGSE